MPPGLRSTFGRVAEPVAEKCHARRAESDLLGDEERGRRTGFDVVLIAAEYKWRAVLHKRLKKEDIPLCKRCVVHPHYAPPA